MGASALACTLVMVAGCGGSGDPDDVAPVPAAGSVTYKGKPVDHGQVVFQPEKGRPARGEIEGGQFTMSTVREGDGAAPGKQHIAVIVTAETKVKGGDTDVTYLVPEKYASPDSSGIEIDLPKGGSRSIQIELQ